MAKQKFVVDETLDQVNMPLLDTDHEDLTEPPFEADEALQWHNQLNEDQLKLPFVRNPYNYDAEKLSKETGLTCNDPSLAVQEAAAETDINNIIRSFGITGQLPSAVRSPTYGDFTGISDYQSALNAVIAADESFMQMPAQIRARFHNDPNAFVEFCSKEQNREEMKKLGLIAPDPIGPDGEKKEGAAPLNPGGEQGLSPSTITNK